MSLILLEAFDDGLHEERYVWNCPAPASSPFSRIGQAMRFSARDQNFRYSIKAADQDDLITLGFWGTPQNTPAGDSVEYAIFQFWSDSFTTYHVGVEYSATGQLRVYRGDGTILGITDVIWPGLDLSRYIEIQVRLHDTTGSVKIWSDGTLMLDLTNIDTRNGGTAAVFDTVRFYNDNSGPAQRANFVLVDIYLTNEQGAAPYNGRLGDIIAVELFPNGNGNYSDFVGGDGNSVDNHLEVDENPAHDVDATYVESVTAGHRDSYGFDDLPYATGTIRGVIVTAAARNLGAADNLQISTRIAAADYDGPTIPAPGAYDADTRRIMELSPATGAAWTIAEVNAAEFGIVNVV